MEQKEFVKHDKEKIRLELLPTVALMEVGKVLTFGAKKYKDGGWRGVDKRSRYYAAILRHAMQWNNGENTDPESGLPHLAHLACSALFLLEAEVAGLGADDRPVAPAPAQTCKHPVRMTGGGESYCFGCGETFNVPGGLP